MHRRQAMRAAVIVNQIRDRFGHLPFDAVAVSCGTCMEALAGMRIESVFGCRVADVSRLALEYGLAAEVPSGRLYHAPCHDSLAGEGVAMLTRPGTSVVAVPYCCGEAGTLALSRPDLAAAMRARKQAAFQEALDGGRGKQTVLTNCPSCLSGLGRNASLGLTVRHLAEELARCVDGEQWLDQTRAWRERAQVVGF
jgi:Fe-S oxidoreductase